MYLKKMASQSLDDYFLGGRKLPWWALGVSGMASFLDITGTMIIVSFLFMLGPRGLFIEFRGGAVLILPFMMLFMGKWHRRSECMTGAEWMIFRFGEGFGGQFARIVQAAGQIILTIGMLAYLVKGVGLFLSMFLPFSPLVCSLVMIGIAALYTMASGFYGVVFTDMFQSVIILIAVIAISVMAMMKTTDVQSLAVLAQEVTGSAHWTTSKLQFYTSMPKGYEAYSHLAMFAMFYLLRNIFGGLGVGDDPKYFGARSDRECGQLTFFWTWLMMIRWPMMMAFAVLGLFLVRDLFPDQAVLLHAADMIKDHIGAVDKSRWADVLSGIAHYPDRYPELVNGLRNLLGGDWQTKLNLLSYEGTVNPERILPAVILFLIPMGFRGMILVALIAASMSTFDSTVNRTAGFFIKDIYQRYLRPSASNKELIYMSWVFIFAVVAIGFGMGYTTRSINDIWGWIIMSFGGGIAVPAMLRFYWWRFNGGGFAVGTVVGMVCAILQRLLFPYLDERLQFVFLISISLTATIIGTFITKPTDRRILENFYRKTRPFGFWGPLRKILPHDQRASMKSEHFYDIISLPFVMIWQITLFMMPMQLIIRAYDAFWATFAVFAACLVAIYFFWYRKLPET
ncbi:MAG: sodium:solute symporter [Candidatus Latescibacteria bacterium]|nr:sodium:solute symporter [Candidatus Latescibacterota bacterium]